MSELQELSTKGCNCRCGFERHCGGIETETTCYELRMKKDLRMFELKSTVEFI